MLHFNAINAVLQAFEQGADLAEQAGPGAGQTDPSGLAFEQRQLEMILKGTHLFAHRALGQAQLAGGSGKAAIAPDGFKGDERVQRR